MVVLDLVIFTYDALSKSPEEARLIEKT